MSCNRGEKAGVDRKRLKKAPQGEGSKEKLLPVGTGMVGLVLMGLLR